MDHTPKRTIQNYKTFRRLHRRKPRWPWYGNAFSDTMCNTQFMKEIMDKLTLSKLKTSALPKSLSREEDRLGGNIYNRHI